MLPCKGQTTPKCNLMRRWLTYINVPRHILTLLVGKDHPIWLRLFVGALIMFGSEFIRPKFEVMDALRGLIHAVGAVPWVEALIEANRKPNE